MKFTVEYSLLVLSSQSSVSWLKMNSEYACMADFVNLFSGNAVQTKLISVDSYKRFARSFMLELLFINIFKTSEREASKNEKERDAAAIIFSLQPLCDALLLETRFCVSSFLF